MATRRQLEEQLVHTSHAVHTRGWVANHDGNLSLRLGDGRFLATPTAMSKGAVGLADLIVVDAAGKVVAGRRKAFSELALHLFIYRQRPDVAAVIHAHPPTATGLAVAGVAVRPTLLAEPVVSLGATIPLVPYARPKSPEWTLNMAPHLADADVLLLENHGVVAYGPDLETAFLRLELVEHLARIQLAAAQMGGARDIPDADVAPLLASRTKAGLGRAARAASAAATQTRADLGERTRAVVADEVARALHD